jgi:hypothetical protein
VALPPPGPTARPGLGLAGLVLAASLLAGCTSSGGGSPSAPASSPASLPTSSAATGLPTTSAAPTTVPGTTAATSPSSTPTTPAAPDTSSPAGRTVTVQITFAGWDAPSHSAQVNAFVPSLVVRDGTCTLTLSSGAVQRTTTVVAHSTPQATNCGLMSIPGAQLSPGSWRAVVSFRSSEAVGASKPTTIQVPS